MSTNLRLALAILTASQIFARPADWKRLQTLSPEERVAVTLRDGKFIEGRFRNWSPTALDIVRQQRTEPLTLEQVERVSVERKGSRAKSALIGALVHSRQRFQLAPTTRVSGLVSAWVAGSRYSAPELARPLALCRRQGARYRLLIWC
jgi:hypothetical protein